MYSDKDNFHAVKSLRHIYTPSSFAKANLMVLQECGYLQATKPHKNQRDFLNSFLLFLVLEGDGYLEYDGETYPLKKGECVFIDCKKPYSHRTGKNLWKLKWVHFYGANMTAIYNKYRERGGLPKFSSENFNTYEKIIDEIILVSDNNTFEGEMNIHSQITKLISVALSEDTAFLKRNEKALQTDTVAEIKNYIDENFASDITVKKIADKFYINNFYLSRIFKEKYGITVVGYIKLVRITEAKRQLRFTYKTVEVISKECGIGDNNYFSRLFKKTEGITPSEYRQMW